MPEERLGRCSDGLGRAGAEVGFNVGYVGKEQEGVGAELAGQKRCRQVLVHHGFDTPQQPVGRPAYRYPASAGADDDGTVA